MLIWVIVFVYETNRTQFTIFQILTFYNLRNTDLISNIFSLLREYDFNIWSEKQQKLLRYLHQKSRENNIYFIWWPNIIFISSSMVQKSISMGRIQNIASLIGLFHIALT